jgi:hypothetical protein
MLRIPVLASRERKLVQHPRSSSPRHRRHVSGVAIDTLYCGNGKWQDDVEDGGDVGTSGWRIVDAKVKEGGRDFTATIEAWIPGGKHVQGIVRNGDTWQIGWEWNREIRDPGPVTKTNVAATCASL